MTGPLDGVKILEFGAIGPAPYGVMLLSDLGAAVVRLDRVAAAQGNPGLEMGMTGVSRNRRSIALDLRQPEGKDVAVRLAAGADVLVEGYRPGVMERLGLGPDELMADHPELIYARMTGYGQDGPMANRTGHDINYLALTGALHDIGDVDRPPPPPLNLVGDFGGGGTFLAIGVLAALVERQVSGRGQVIDAAMVDGASSLTAFMRGMEPIGAWRFQRGANALDGSHPFYRCYECADGEYMAVGAAEPHFYAELLDKLGLDTCDWAQYDRNTWPDQHQRMEEIFLTRTRDEWAEHFADSQACVSPVLGMAEAPDDPHNLARDAFVELDGFKQPAIAPRLSRTPGEVRSGAPGFGEHTDEVLRELGLDDDRIDHLRAIEAVA